MLLASMMAIFGWMPLSAEQLAAWGMLLLAKTMFPDGLHHDFGKVPSGKEVKHVFRIVNTSTVPLEFVSLKSG